MPLVLAYHGGATDAETMCRFSGLDEKAEQLLDEMLLKWGTSPEVLALTQRGYAEIKRSDLFADNDEPIIQPHKTAPAKLHIVAA